MGKMLPLRQDGNWWKVATGIEEKENIELFLMYKKEKKMYTFFYIKMKMSNYIW